MSNQYHTSHNKHIVLRVLINKYNASNILIILYNGCVRFKGHNPASTHLRHQLDFEAMHTDKRFGIYDTWC